MQIGLSGVLFCIIVFYPLLFPLRGGRMLALNSEYKLTKVILRVGCLSHNPTPSMKSALIHKPTAQIHKAFNQHDNSWIDNKLFRYKYFNIVI